MLKRVYFVLIILLALSTNYSFSQKQRGFENIIEAHLAPDIKFSDADYNLHYANGFRFNQNVFLGGGIGISMKKTSDEKDRINFGNAYKEIDSKTYISIPVYGRFKANFTKTKVSPFTVIDLGYMFGNNAIDEINTSGLFFHPSVGLDIYKVYLKLGLYIQQNKNYLTWELEDGAFTKLSICVGITL